MKQENKISVIVPIYNVEKYLEKCIQSIINQSYTNLEIILVDDGSPDNCGEICDQYAQKDQRIKVIHKLNGGLADARNAGIDIMTGDYVAFVDSDDYIHPQMYERMMCVVEEKKSDIVISSWKYVKEEQDEQIQAFNEKPNAEIIDRKTLQYMYYEDMDKSVTLTVAWNKLYKREIFENLRYPKGKVHEDEFVTFKALYIANKVAYVDEVFYFYLVRNVSIMGAFNLKRFDIFDSYCEKLKFYIEHDEKELVKKITRKSIHMIAMYYELIDKNKSEEKNKFLHYYELIKKGSIEASKKADFGLGLKTELIIFENNFSLFRLLWKIMTKLKKNA